MEIDFLLQVFLMASITRSRKFRQQIIIRPRAGHLHYRKKGFRPCASSADHRPLFSPCPETGYGCALLPAGGSGNPAFFIHHTFQSLIQMITGIIEKVKEFLMNPVDAFQQAKGDEPGTVLPYFALLLLLYSIISALLVEAMIGTIPIPGLVTGGISGAGLVFFIILVGGFAGALVFGAWLHLWVYIFGGRRGIWQTLKVVMYGNTPFLLFGWIPFIGFVFLCFDPSTS